MKNNFLFLQALAAISVLPTLTATIRLLVVSSVIAFLKVSIKEISSAIQPPANANVNTTLSVVNAIVALSVIGYDVVIHFLYQII